MEEINQTSELQKVEHTILDEFNKNLIAHIYSEIEKIYKINIEQRKSSKHNEDEEKLKQQNRKLTYTISTSRICIYIYNFIQAIISNENPSDVKLPIENEAELGRIMNRIKEDFNILNTEIGNGDNTTYMYQILRTTHVICNKLRINEKNKNDEENKKMDICNRLIADIVLELNFEEALKYCYEHSNVQEPLVIQISLKLFQYFKSDLLPKVISNIWGKILPVLLKMDIVQYKKVMTEFAKIGKTKNYGDLKNLDIEDFNSLFQNYQLDLSKFRDYQRNCTSIEKYETNINLVITPYEINVRQTDGTMTKISCMIFNDDKNKGGQKIFDCDKINGVEFPTIAWSERLKKFKEICSTYSCIDVESISRIDISKILTNKPTSFIYIKTSGFGIGTYYKYNGITRNPKRKYTSEDENPLKKIK